MQNNFFHHNPSIYFSCPTKKASTSIGINSITSSCPSTINPKMLSDSFNSKKDINQNGINPKLHQLQAASAPSRHWAQLTLTLKCPKPQRGIILKRYQPQNVISNWPQPKNRIVLNWHHPQKAPTTPKWHQAKDGFNLKWHLPQNSINGN